MPTAPLPTADAMLHSDFATLPDLIAAHARERRDKTALIHGDDTLDYATLDARMDRFAARLQADGVAQGAAIAIVGPVSIAYAVVFLGALRAACVPTPIAPSSTPEQIAAMIADCGAPVVFADAGIADAVPLADLAAWLAPEGACPAPVTIAPGDPFNIIYSSGTTGTPKGIVQSHAMRWAHIARNETAGFDTAVTMISTPLYSNTTLVSFLPTLAWGGTVVLLGKFDARAFLEAAAAHHATHAMLVPVQYARIMAVPDFDMFDLSAFRLKTCTSAPFSAALKAEVVARWPGLLVEYYGMTEGGGTCLLIANAFPDKLHTVGRPIDGHDIRLIDDDGHEVAPGEMGEVVGRSPAMMTGYHGRSDATSAAEWFDAEGNRYIRHGDVGRFDADGFLQLLDRKKDVIISGGFNIYPTDIEGVLNAHPSVADGTVVGVPSAAWGETPVGFYVPAPGGEDAEAIRAYVNARVGKNQRLSALEAVDEMPRNAIGKVLKRELRDRWVAAQGVAA
ncbi:acyl--CoA ligase [Sphingomonas donggukensis]|uniref:Acyl--CoA ligase n=1 Tax=Sphingomonas donggukensis TaxID=2949093 RepID=A0ABY4TX20_9SPHN|nr:class I adenylate-forming enzyme family protein [Sphingomonas donggukensis]URW76524.1 acyl--CoA ligase [Sphingomonas donggukensis]